MKSASKQQQAGAKEPVKQLFSHINQGRQLDPCHIHMHGKREKQGDIICVCFMLLQRNNTNKTSLLGKKQYTITYLHLQIFPLISICLQKCFYRLFQLKIILDFINVYLASQLGRTLIFQDLKVLHFQISLCLFVQESSLSQHLNTSISKEYMLVFIACNHAFMRCHRWLECVTQYDYFLL